MRTKIILFILLFINIVAGQAQTGEYSVNGVTFKVTVDNEEPIRVDGNTMYVKTAAENFTGTLDISFDSDLYFDLYYADLGIFPKGDPPAILKHTYSTPKTPKTVSLDLATDTWYELSVLYKSGLGGLTKEINLRFESEPLIALAGSDKSVNCGGSVTIGGNPAATGGSESYDYSWTASTGESVANVARPTVSPAGKTTYTLTVTDRVNGQTATDQVDVTVNETMNRPVISGSSGWGLCPTTSQKYSISPVAGAVSYQWTTSYGYITRYYYTNGKKTGVQISATNIAIRKRVAGLLVTCKATSACGNTEIAKKNVDFYYPQCGIFPVRTTQKSTLRLSPNPVTFQTQRLKIQLENKTNNNVAVTVYDMQGAKLMSFEEKSQGSFEKNFNVKDLGLKPGLYIVQVINGKEVYKKRLFVRE